MNTNRYIQEYLVVEHQHEYLQEAEQRRHAAHVAHVARTTHTASSHNALRHLIGRCGALLVALGSRMERMEQTKHETAFVAGGSTVSGRLR